MNRILIVDDEENILNSIKRIFLDDNYNIEVARDGHEALKSISSFDPDLIVLDIMMPGLDGYEVCRRLKSDDKTSEIMILFLSGKITLKDRLKGYETGVDDYITKPYDPEELRAKIKILLSLKNIQKALQKEINERKKAEEALRKQTHALSKRVKELNCLYGISKLTEIQDVSLDEIFKGVVDLIPPAWQYPEITCSRITWENQEFKTKIFKSTTWNQSCDIIMHGNKIGIVEGCYLEERPESFEGPFLQEERSLINTVGERLGRISERKHSEELLRLQSENINKIFL